MLNTPANPTKNEPAEVNRLLEKRENELADARIRIRQLEAALDARSAEVAALRRIGEVTGHVVNTDDILPLVAEIAVEVTNTESAQVYLFNEARDALVLRASTTALPDAIGKVQVKMGEGITGWVAQSKEHVALSHDAGQDERFKYIPELDAEDYQSILSVPLVWRGEVIGVVNVRTKAPHEYGKTQVQMLSSVAGQVAGAIQASRKYRSVEKRASALSTVAEVSKTITSNLYLEEILQLAVAAMAQTLNFKVVVLLLAEEGKNKLFVKAVQGSKDYAKKAGLGLGEGISGKAMETGKVQTVLDVTKSPEYAQKDLARQMGFVSLASVPLKVRERVIGVLNCYTDQPRRFTEDEISVLTTLGNQVAVAMDNAKLMVKGALLQEMHHRVKNNLQTIASLLRLQSHYAAGRSSVEVLTESVNRVLAVAAVHDLLSREDLDTISVKKIAEQIMMAIKQSYVSPEKQITFSMEGPDLLLAANQANSVSLILNEMVQNAVEHGFKVASAGEIKVRLTDLPENWLLEVRNDGDPLPENFDPKQNADLGLRIIDSLIHGDLSGEFVIKRDGDQTVASITFPKR
jgi:two-component system, sensor histidine kinase PdtaS